MRKEYSRTYVFTGGTKKSQKTSIASSSKKTSRHANDPASDHRLSLRELLTDSSSSSNHSIPSLERKQKLRLMEIDHLNAQVKDLREKHEKSGVTQLVNDSMCLNSSALAWRMIAEDYKKNDEAYQKRLEKERKRIRDKRSRDDDRSKKNSTRFAHKKFQARKSAPGC